MNGAAYVAYGARAVKEVIGSIRTLREHNDLSVAVVGDRCPLNGVETIPFRGTIVTTDVEASRWAKLNLNNLIPASWEQAVYIDADTRVLGDLSAGFAILDDGWDMAIAPSEYQGSELLHHVDADERRATLEILPGVLGLQAGMFFFHRERCGRLFAAWRDEWLKWRSQDQAALLRALWREPVRLWLLGLPWNSRDGTVVQHRFGKARN